MQQQRWVAKLFTVDRFATNPVYTPATLPAASAALTEVGTYAIFDIPDGYEVLNTLTGKWTATKFPHIFGAARSGFTLGTDAVIAGHNSNIVDIFDSTTEQWSTATVSADAYWGATAVLGNKAYLGGGASPDDGKNVDVFTDSSPTFSLNGSFDRVGQNTLAVAVRNVGDAALPAGYTIQMTASNTRAFNSRSVLLGGTTLAAPVAGGSVSVVNIALTNPTQGLPPGSYDLIAAAVPPGRGHGVLFASQLNAISVRAPARTAQRELLPAATDLTSPAPFSTQPILSSAPAAATDTQFGKDQREVDDALA